MEANRKKSFAGPTGSAHVTIIQSTGTKGCKLCGKVAELRPYGPGGLAVCFECAMKDEPNAQSQFKALLDKGTVVIIPPNSGLSDGNDHGRNS